jgi:hypothetical protein
VPLREAFEQVAPAAARAPVVDRKRQAKAMMLIRTAPPAEVNHKDFRIIARSARNSVLISLMSSPYWGLM